ncbi:MAG: dihydroxy-acid dehydratase [Nitrospiraceae bacterium]
MQAATLVAKRLIDAKIHHPDQITVTGKTIGGEAKSRRNSGAASTAAISRPDQAHGRLVILKGNLAPEGCVVKVAGHSIMHFRGPAKVYDREEDAFAAVKSGKIKAGDVVGDSL